MEASFCARKLHRAAGPMQYELLSLSVLEEKVYFEAMIDVHAALSPFRQRVIHA